SARVAHRTHPSMGAWARSRVVHLLRAVHKEKFGQRGPEREGVLTPAAGSTGTRVLALSSRRSRPRRVAGAATYCACEVGVPSPPARVRWPQQRATGVPAAAAGAPRCIGDGGMACPPPPPLPHPSLSPPPPPPPSPAP